MSSRPSRRGSTKTGSKGTLSPGNSALPIPADYAAWLADLKSRIAGARARASLAANAEQIQLYHDVGRDILTRQSRAGWGAKVIDRLSADLRAAFPDMKGLSSSNLKYMKHFAQECPDRQFGQQTADQLPWFHIIALITQVSDPAVRMKALSEPPDGLPSIEARVAELDAKVAGHLRRMGFTLGAPGTSPARSASEPGWCPALPGNAT